LLGSGTVGDGSIGEHSAKIDPATGGEISPALYPWLRDGDEVEMEVEMIGTLSNKVKIE
jgi:2-keto-4-pentenoate hydratase/2-oxohepta-3-ene-1,7-dioic acid hydratase in catechol pathway